MNKKLMRPLILFLLLFLCVLYEDGAEGLDVRYVDIEKQGKEEQSYKLSVIRFIKESRACLSKNDLKCALKFARDAVAIDPAYFEAWKQLGRVQLLKGEYEEAQSAFDLALTLNPDDLEIHTWIVHTYILLDKIQEAIGYLEKNKQVINKIDNKIVADLLLNFYEKNDFQLMERIILLWAGETKQKIKESIADDILKIIRGDTKSTKYILQSLKTTDDIKPFISLAWYLIGTVDFKEGDYIEAIESFKKALENRINWIPPLRELGWSYKLSGQYEKAVDTWLEGIQINKSLTNWFLWIIETCIEAGKYDLALESVEKFLKLLPDDHEVNAMKLSLLIFRNDEEEIGKFLSKITKSLFRDYIITKGYAFGYKLKGMFREAEIYLDNYLQKYPEDKQIRKMLVNIYIDWSSKVPLYEAEYPLQRLVSLEPMRKSAWRDLGWSYWVNGKIDDAIYAWEQAIKGELPEKEKVMLQIIAKLIEERHERKALELLYKWVPNVSFFEYGFKLLNMNRLIPSRLLFLEAWEKGENLAMSGFYLAYTESHFNMCESIHEHITPYFQEKLNFANKNELEMLVSMFQKCTKNTKMLSLLDKLESALDRYDDLSFIYNEFIEHIANEMRITRKMDEAWKFYKKLLKRNSNNKVAWLHAAMVGDELGLGSEVETVLNDVLLRTSSDVVKEGIKGWLAENKEDYIGAVFHYQKSIEKDPEQPDLRFALFKDLIFLQKYEDAMIQFKWFDEKYTSGDNTVQVYYAEIVSALKKTSEALNIWKELHFSYPEVPHYAIEYSRNLYLECRADEAINVLEQYLDKQPNQRAFELIIEIYEALGQSNKVLYWSEKALSYGEKTSIRRMKLDAAEMAKQYNIVINEAESILQKEPWNIRGSTAKGLALVENMNYEDAIKYYQTLIERNNQFLPALLYLRDVKSWIKDIDDAVFYGESIIKYRPWDLTNTLRYSSLLADVENYRKAYRVLRPLVEIPINYSTPILIYRDITSCQYPARNNIEQVKKHLIAISKEGYRFISPIELESSMKQDKKNILVVILKTDLPAFIELDNTLKDVDGKAVLTYSTLINIKHSNISFSALEEILLSGRWIIAWDGPFQKLYVPIDEKNKGNLLTHKIVVNGVKEDLNAMEKRLDRIFSEGANLISNFGSKIFLYPEGDYGQFSLDTDFEAVETLHKVIGKHFDFAIVGDYYGFCSQSFDPLRLPGKYIPPVWNDKDLIEFLQEKNPLVMARLELAKVYSRQGQYEKANEWFKIAQSLGADPKEVNFHWGNNAYFERDYPTSIRKLNYALMLEPNSEKILKSLDRARLKTRYNVNPFMRGWQDSDDRSSRSFGGAFSGYINELIKFELFYEKNIWERVGFGKERGNKYGFGLLWHFKEGYWINGKMWNMNLKKLNDYIGGVINIHLPNPSFSGYVDVQASREEIETVEAVRREIISDNLALFTHSRIIDFWDLFANFVYTERSDNNKTIMLNGRFVYRIKEWPFYGVGYLFRFADSNRKVPEYYAPKSLQQHQIYATTRGEYKRLHYSLSLYGGYAKEYKTNWRFVWGSRIDVDLDLLSRFVLNGGIIYHESPIYNNIIWNLGLKFIF